MIFLLKHLRPIIPALVALLVSGPAWAAEDDAILLHCGGLHLDPVKKFRHGSSKNILIARDGSWISYGGLPDKNFNLPQLRHYFFGFGASVRHF